MSGLIIPVLISVFRLPRKVSVADVVCDINDDRAVFSDLNEEK